ncbi:MAG TPA: hypothetical protein ENO08_05890, partial [Candidatus Eisenbacteria bacterium]|nr:hypothetical protein [Candidatus Eisenbacteria bacterium]
MPRNGTFIAAPLIAALALLAPAELQHDGASIGQYKLGDIPLHILPLDEAADILSRHRYQSCSDTQKPVWDLQYTMWDRGERENVDYLFREALRVGLLIHKAFN